MFFLYHTEENIMEKPKFEEKDIDQEIRKRYWPRN